MEAFLNVLWLVMALATVCVAFLAAAGPANRRSRGRMVALCCSLILVFPLISVTDDLQSYDAITEDGDCTSTQGRVIKSADYRTTVHSNRHVPAEALRAWSHNPDWRVVGSILLSEIQRGREVSSIPAAERAPPLSLFFS